MTDITHCKKVYVSTSKSADYVSAVDHDGAVEFVMADSVQALVDALRGIAQRKTPLEMSHTEFCYADFQGECLAPIEAARAALKQWDDGE